ncbi:MAG: RNA polymerase sigma factor [Planctomycetes bacterium]|nr:RNA polymerase sigma factor [Planctomycetota bacterium]
MTTLESEHAMHVHGTAVAEPVMDVERVFDRCARALCRYFAVRTGDDEHTVDDLMQQLWLQARRKAYSVRQPNAEAWLWRVAQNLLRAHWRSRGQRPQQVPLADPQLAAELARRFDTEELPAEVLARKEVRDQLLLALTALPGAEQELLLGHYFLGLSHAALSEEHGISERAVEGRLYRARQLLRDKLKHLEI